MALRVSPQYHKGHLHLVTILTSTLSQRPAPTASSSLHPVIIPHPPKLRNLLVQFYLSLTTSNTAPANWPSTFTKSLQMVTTAMKLKDSCSLEEKL